LNIQTSDQSPSQNLVEITAYNIPSEEILLQDAFNRAGANALGAPWTEGNEATAEYINSKGRKVGPGYIELNNNALAFHYNNHSQKVALDTSFNHRPYVTAPFSKLISTYPITLYFTFTPHTDERTFHEIGLMSATDGLTQMTDPTSGAVYFVPKNGLGIYLLRSSSNFNNSRVEVIEYVNNVRTILAQKNLTFQFESSEVYTIQMTIQEDFTTKVVISSPTEFNELTYQLNSIPFPLNQFFLTDTEGGISSDTTGPADFRLFFDNVLVKQTFTEIPPAPHKQKKMIMTMTTMMRMSPRPRLKPRPFRSKYSIAGPGKSSSRRWLYLMPAVNACHRWARHCQPQALMNTWAIQPMLWSRMPPACR
jgi:hypothetical protein